jgi:HTH-type transcriptional regulator / antitoxin PezA
MQQTVNQRIKIIRKELEMGQQEFADSIKVKQSSISRIESGVNTPDERTLELICSKHGVNIKWLTDGTGEMFVPGENIAPVKTEVEFLREIVTSHVTTIAELSRTNGRLSETVEKTLNEILSLLKSGGGSTARLKSSAHG